MKNALILLALVSSFVLIGCPAETVEPSETPKTTTTNPDKTGDDEASVDTPK